MDAVRDRQAAQASYKKMKASIDETYPKGRFVALDAGKIVADAARFDDLSVLVEARGKKLKDLFVVQAGVEYPESVTIFLRLSR